MHVLIVEDEVALAATVRSGLQSEGFNVDVVHDGVDGLWAASNREYDAIVLDLMLPGIGGYDIVRGLRDQLVWTPILVLTAKDQELDETTAFDGGADDYLTKPFTFNVLVARLNALIRRGAPQRPMVLQAGDLNLDPGRRRVRRGNVEIQLTAREFAVLHYLFRNADAVVSKTTILENVWDAHYGGDLNIVEVYIGYLRRKIDLPFGRTSIQTVRGAGYRLSADGG